jgi:hypothetical protein
MHAPGIPVVLTALALAAPVPAALTLAAPVLSAPIPALLAQIPPATPPSPRTFEDETIHVDLPSGWHIEGEDGEYLLESTGPDVASLLVLPPDPVTSLEERLAEIEEQFLSTGVISLETSRELVEDGQSIHYRKYSLRPAGAADDSATVHFHQYSFWRAGSRVLLLIETSPGLSSQDDLFFRTFHTLEIRKAPLPFTWEDPLEPDEGEEGVSEAGASKEGDAGAE